MMEAIFTINFTQGRSPTFIWLMTEIKTNELKYADSLF